jgi:hypothetical protein
MRIPRWQKFDPDVRLFEVECRCGAEFRVHAEADPGAPVPAEGFLVQLSGQCPWCGLRLEEIEPFGTDVPLRPAPRS